MTGLVAIITDLFTTLYHYYNRLNYGKNNIWPEYFNFFFNYFIYIYNIYSIKPSTRKIIIFKRFDSKYFKAFIDCICLFKISFFIFEVKFLFGNLQLVPSPINITLNSLEFLYLDKTSTSNTSSSGCAAVLIPFP